MRFLAWCQPLYVRYRDGYESWSPAEAFESGYTPLDGSGAEAGLPAGHEQFLIRVIGNGAGIVRLSESAGATQVDDDRRADMHRMKQLLAACINEIDATGNDPRTTALARTKLQEAGWAAMHSITAPKEG
ncbi:MAG: hypothetical protein OXC08_18855 [Thiotrichales bacterium]|nr:hypothetical protein [Thiotrichales bacterium]